MTLTVRVIAPDKIVWDNPAQEVILPSTTGQLGILNDHAPLLTALDIGVMRVRSEKDWENIVLMGGFAEVEDNEVKILVNGAQLAQDIDLAEANKQYESAKAQLEKTETGTKQEQMQAQKDLKRARARVLAVGGNV